MSMTLKTLRKKHGLTQEELAKKMNVARTTIMMIEAGKMTPSFEKADKIACFFDTPIEEIFPAYKRTSPYPNYNLNNPTRSDETTR
jgi:putative transcriptional regulator